MPIPKAKEKELPYKRGRGLGDMILGWFPWHGAHWGRQALVPKLLFHPLLSGGGRQCWLAWRGTAQLWWPEQNHHKKTLRDSQVSQPWNQGFKHAGGLCLMAGTWLVHPSLQPRHAPGTSCIATGSSGGNLPSWRGGRMLLL